MTELLTIIAVAVVIGVAAGFGLGWLAFADKEEVRLPSLHRPLPNKGSSGSREPPSLELIIREGQERLRRHLDTKP